MPQYKYTKEILESAVSESKNLKQVLRLIGATSTGSIRRHIRNRINKYGISTSHFTNCPDIVPCSKEKMQPEEVLVYSDKDYRQRASRLSDAMMLKGIKYECGKCKNTGSWHEEKLVLQVHHKDGDWHNNRLDNLMFACPNCHSQLDKKKPKKINRCGCGKKITRYAKHCVACLPRSEISTNTWKKK